MDKKKSHTGMGENITSRDFMKNKFQYTNAVRLLEKNKTQMISLHDYAEELIKKHEQTLTLTYRHIEDKRREIKILEEIVMKHSM